MGLPDWVRARGMSMYQMAIMGASALGAALWGQVATSASVTAALVAAAASGTICMLLAQRFVLDLSRSRNGQDWTLAQTLVRGVDPEEYSYPSMAWAGDSLWVSYTHHRKSIAWQRLGFEAAP